MATQTVETKEVVKPLTMRNMATLRLAEKLGLTTEMLLTKNASIYSRDEVEVMITRASENAAEYMTENHKHLADDVRKVMDDTFDDFINNSVQREDSLGDMSFEDVRDIAVHRGIVVPDEFDLRSKKGKAECKAKLIELIENPEKQTT